MSSTAKTPALTLAALGIVFGDIGTSPLYTLKECTHSEHGVPPNIEANVLGVLSLIVWSLMLVVTVKYLFFIMRADNQGEGGILALLALVIPRRTPKDDEKGPVRRRRWHAGKISPVEAALEGAIAWKRS